MVALMHLSLPHLIRLRIYLASHVLLAGLTLDINLVLLNGMILLRLIQVVLSSHTPTLIMTLVLCEILRYP
jgi:hypothetical protein